QPGLLAAKVQGRMPQSYAVAIRLPVFTAEQWDQAISAMVAQARYAASLLSGDLPAGIEDVFAPIGLRLVPSEPSDLAVSCTCAAAASAGPGVPAGRAAGGWCKHVCCAMILLADRLGIDPFAIFQLRGMRGEELLDRLRQQRAAAGAARTTAGPAADV